MSRASPAMVTDLANAVAFPPWSDPDDPYAHKVSNVATRNNAILYDTDQSLSKAASLREGAKGDRATFNITVQNTGDTLINRSELTDLLPDGLKFISSVPPITSSTINSNGSTTLYWGTSASRSAPSCIRERALRSRSLPNSLEANTANLPTV